MFPTRGRRSRISRTLSHPIGAEALSQALRDVPQAPSLVISFDGGAWFIGSRPGHVSRYQVLEARYQQSNWELHISPVQRSLRHIVRNLLDNEGLPRVREWLLRSASLQDHGGGHSFTIIFDEIQQVLAYEEWHRGDTPPLSR